jgi:hypothetical protein
MAYTAILNFLLAHVMGLLALTMSGVAHFGYGSCGLCEWYPARTIYV